MGAILQSLFLRNEDRKFRCDVCSKTAQSESMTFELETGF